MGTPRKLSIFGVFSGKSGRSRILRQVREFDRLRVIDQGTEKPVAFREMSDHVRPFLAASPRG